MPNIFTSSNKFTTTSSRKRINRENLIDTHTAYELNTYENFGIFLANNDLTNTSIDTETGEETGTSVVPNSAVRSLFNKYSHVLTGGGAMDEDVQEDADSQFEEIVNRVDNASTFRLSNNVPLVDTESNRAKMRRNSGCSVKELVQASEAGMFGKSGYSYSDFMYCRYLGQIPNNYLITLRRYPIPIGDTMTPQGWGEGRKNYGQTDYASPVGTMITWLGAPGNEMQNILGYTYEMSWEEQQAKWEEMQKSGGESGFLNAFERAFNPQVNKMRLDGINAQGATPIKGGIINNGSEGPYPSTLIAPQKVYGNIDRVKKITMRGESGLSWSNNFNLQFEYELKAYNGINPRQAMLDLISNILQVTYTQGEFWGGGYYGGGVRQSSAFQNLALFKKHGNWNGFFNTFSDTLSGLGNIAAEGIGLKSGDGFIDSVKKTLAYVGNFFLGSLLNRLGRPAKYYAPALLGNVNTGLWHVTVGNPWHPIVSMGNLIIKGVKIEHSGPLGLDDFPTYLKVTMSVEHAKPRDLREHEQIYMGGDHRISYSQDQKVMDMYNAAAVYQGVGGSSSSFSDSVAQYDDKGNLIKGNVESGKTNSAIMMKYFGSEKNFEPILWTAKEMAHGQDATTPKSSVRSPQQKSNTNQVAGPLYGK